MQIPESLHAWDVTPKEAIAIQNRLASRVSHEAETENFRFVAGADISIFPAGRGRGAVRYCSGIIIWDMKNSTIVETQTAGGELAFPYIPGLLSFREVPTILEALEKVQHAPDVLMCDGQGYAHPRRFGLACHLGMLLDMPSIGCAKSRLCGVHSTPDEKRGSRARLTDKDELIGTVVRTRDKVKPVYVSVGHKVDLQTAVKTVLACTAGYRLPEPTRQAHKLVSSTMRESILTIDRRPTNL